MNGRPTMIGSVFRSVLGFYMDDPGLDVKTRDVAERAGCSVHTAVTHLKILEDEHLVCVVRRTRTGPKSWKPTAFGMWHRARELHDALEFLHDNTKRSSLEGTFAEEDERVKEIGLGIIERARKAARHAIFGQSRCPHVSEADSFGKKVGCMRLERREAPLWKEGVLQ